MTTEHPINLIEVGASTSYSNTRDYGVHPMPSLHTEDWELPVLIGQQVPDILPEPEEWLKWGRHRRTKEAKAWHHYAADTKLTTLLRDPQQLVDSGSSFTTEVNSSSYSDDPLPVALAALWRKRCISRYWQDQGINVFVDVNVAGWTRELMFQGVPATHGLYATRYMKTDLSGHEAGTDLLWEDYGAVLDHCNTDTDILFAVYGGGKKVEEMCEEYAWLWLPPYNHKSKEN